MLSNPVPVPAQTAGKSVATAASTFALGLVGLALSYFMPEMATQLQASGVPFPTVETTGEAFGFLASWAALSLWAGVVAYVKTNYLK